MGSVYSLLFVVVLGAVNPTLGADHSFIVRNGEPIKPFRCLTEGGKPYLWKAYRIEGNNIGRPINISGFISAEGYLHFIVNDTLNTGYYYCVDAVDDQEIYEKYVLLTERERLQISPSPVLRVNSTRIATIVITFVQFKGTPEHPKTFYVYFLPDTASERFEFEPILEPRIKNGVASFTFNATENGSMSVEAEFTVGHTVSIHTVPQNHRVTSDVVHVILETDEIPPPSTIDKEESTDPPGLSAGAVAGIISGALFLVLAVVGFPCTINLIVYGWLRRPRRQRPNQYDSISMRTAAEEEDGLDGQHANAQLPIPP